MRLSRKESVPPMPDTLAGAQQCTSIDIAQFVYLSSISTQSQLDEKGKPISSPPHRGRVCCCVLQRCCQHLSIGLRGRAAVAAAAAAAAHHSIYHCLPHPVSRHQGTEVGGRVLMLNYEESSWARATVIAVAPLAYQVFAKLQSALAGEHIICHNYLMHRKPGRNGPLRCAVAWASRPATHALNSACPRAELGAVSQLLACRPIRFLPDRLHQFQLQPASATSYPPQATELSYSHLSSEA